MNSQSSNMEKTQADSTKSNVTSPIAVVGIGCRYPGSQTPKQLWGNILARRREFRRFPDQRLPVSDYYDPDRNTPDKIYTSRAAYIDGFDFDWIGRRIPKKTFLGTDIVQWLALEVAEAALKDAGYSKESVPKERTCVIVGNTLTGEQSRANSMRLRWPFVRRALLAAAKVNKLAPQAVRKLIETMEPIYKSVFPTVDEDTLQGGLPNTIAGRVCNYFDLHGGGYNVDGACSSSLLAVCTAANHLASGEVDIALAGGIDVSLDTFELIGFAKTGALTSGDMNVYDKRGAGFLPGEGCGFVVLKRLEDAQEDGDEIYSVLNGWGVSSDGKGGITAPSSRGQSLAIRRAYEKAGYSPHSLDFIEGHGTGTTVGDRTELEGIALALDHYGKAKERSCGVTSFKSIVGHTKAAAGIGAFIKTVMATNRRVLPPTAGCFEPNDIFSETAKSLYPILQGKVFDASRKLRAGVSAMGFGGINSHVTLESYGLPSDKLAPDEDEQALLAHRQVTEVFVISAQTITELRSRLLDLAKTVVDLSLSDLTDLAADLSAKSSPKDQYRACVVAGLPDELSERLLLLDELLGERPLNDGETINDPLQNIWAGNNVVQSRLGYLFPGQGSQHLAMARVLVERFQWARDLVSKADEISERELGIHISDYIYRKIDQSVNADQTKEWIKNLSSTRYAQPAICLASLLYIRYLSNLGIKPSVVGGHSLGELTAFHMTGAFDEEELIRLVILRGWLMDAAGKNMVNGGMASLTASKEKVQKIISEIDGYVIIANINSPRQTVITGDKQAVDAAIALAGKQGIDGRRLPVSGAFHSKYMQKAATQFESTAIMPATLGELTLTLISSKDGKQVKKGLNLPTHFSSQIVSQVNFIDLVEEMQKQCDVLLEVGPGRVLSGLVEQNIEGKEAGVKCSPVASKADIDRDLNVALARVYVHGVDINWSVLYENRLIRPFVAAADRLFIESPCERPFPDIESIENDTLQQTTSANSLLESQLLETSGIEEGILTDYVYQRKEFLSDVIKADLRSLSNIGNSDFDYTGFNSEQKLETYVDEESKGLSASEITVNEVYQVSDQFSVENLLRELVAERTGFPLQTIEMESRLLDDFNLDSIKAGELIASASLKLNVAGQIDPSNYANSTLNEISSALNKINIDVNGNESDRVKLDDNDDNNIDIEILLRDLVSERTGFPTQSILPESRLLDDLNLDSIKAGELIAVAAQKTGVAGVIEPSVFANATLKEIAIEIESALAGKKPVDDNNENKPESNKTFTNQTIVNILKELVVDRTGCPSKSVSIESRLLDDLNIDSIIANELMMTAANEIGASGEFEPSNYENSTLKEIAKELFCYTQNNVVNSSRKDAILSSVNTNNNDLVMSQVDKKSLISDWVRNYSIEYTHQPLLESEITEDWSKAKVLILAPTTGFEQALSLCEKLSSITAEVIIEEYHSVVATDFNTHRKHTHVIGFLENTAERNRSEDDYLKRAVERLHSVVSNATHSQSENVAFIQYGGGYFKTGRNISDIGMGCATSFARTLVLEKPQLKIRVIDLDILIDNKQAVDFIVKEIGTSSAFSAAGFDVQKNRLIPNARLQQPALYENRQLKWTSDDVFMITGGAKGITAECALALARFTGAKFALIGSSALPDENQVESDNEIIRTINRFKNEGFICKYYSCDISDAQAVTQLVGKIKQELGPVTGVVHGAGLNKPRPIDQVSIQQALQEIEPKLQGVCNIAKALDSSPPKLFVGFSSIIGVTGMPGNAWYAFSNEGLTQELRLFEARHPETSTLSIAYSVWGEAGMGHRLGVVDKLEKSGVGAISTAEGVNRFIQLVEGNPDNQLVIVTSSLAGLETWSDLSPAHSLPQGARFLENVLSFESGVELVARTKLNTKRDLYLKDHDFKGSYLLPTVFGLEAMVQAATYITGKSAESIAAIKDIRLELPISANPLSGIEIEIRAIVMEQGLDGSQYVHVGIRTEHTGFVSDHFSATIIIGESKKSSKQNFLTNNDPLLIDPETDLYGGLLFQGPLFQRMQSIYELDSEKVIFKTNYVNSLQQGSNGFSSDKNDELIFSDPFFRDVLLQSAQLVTTPDIVLPVGIGRIDIYKHDSKSGNRYVTSTLKLREKSDYIFDVIAVNEDGEVVEKLEDYRVRILERSDAFYTPDILSSLSRFDEKQLQGSFNEIISSLNILNRPTIELNYIPVLHELSKNERHIKEAPLIKHALNMAVGSDEYIDSDIDINWTKSGKPYVDNSKYKDLDISLTHDDEYCLCVVGDKAQGCDIEVVSKRSRQDWIALLSNSRTDLLDKLINSGDSLDLSGTRIWTVVEAVKKASGSVSMDLKLDSIINDSLIFEATTTESTFTIISQTVSLLKGKNRVVSLVVENLNTMEGQKDDINEYA